jgi:hypothetical protein
MELLFVNIFEIVADFLGFLIFLLGAPFVGLLLWCTTSCFSLFCSVVPSLVERE